MRNLKKILALVLRGLTLVFQAKKLVILPKMT